MDEVSKSVATVPSLWDPSARRVLALQAALQAGLLNEDDDQNLGLFLDEQLFLQTLRSSCSPLYPPGTLHTFAVKANPVGGVLALVRDAGLGAEVCMVWCGAGRAGRLSGGCQGTWAAQAGHTGKGGGSAYTQVRVHAYGSSGQRSSGMSQRQ